MKKTLSIIIDLVLGAIVAALLERIIAPSLLDVPVWPINWISWVFIGGVAVCWMLLGLIHNASLGRLYIGLEVKAGPARSIATHL
ncbi:MAG: hypothetical protein H7X70_03975, partial [Candidatus Kapabacteria bacterium]|nr:hypothetical protein [Candidatus Kapabacteria bacterium]